MGVRNQRVEADFANDWQATCTLLAGVAPVDVTGWTIVFTVRDQVNPNGVVLIAATTTLTNPTQGQFVISIGASQFLNATLSDGSPLVCGKYPYEMRRTDSGFNWTLASGQFLIVP